MQSPDDERGPEHSLEGEEDLTVENVPGGIS